MARRAWGEIAGRLVSACAECWIVRGQDQLVKLARVMFANALCTTAASCTGHVVLSLFLQQLLCNTSSTSAAHGKPAGCCLPHQLARLHNAAAQRDDSPDLKDAKHAKHVPCKAATA